VRLMTDPHLSPPQRPSRIPSVILGMSLMLNLLVLVVVVLAYAGLTSLGGSTDESSPSLTEHYHSGKKSAAGKVAVVRIEGVLLEGMNGFAEKQIEQAAQDKHVKAVVVRINSPGGSITASDDLHRRLSRLRDGVAEKGTAAKPIVVSMASMAASGGYYIAMPAQALYAERTTVTGSIGVYASFPEVTGLSEKIGVDMTIVKRGAVKASGNPFRKLSDEEYAVWDEMVGHAYDQFLGVVKAGRGERLKADLTAEVINEERVVTFDGKDAKQQAVQERRKVHYVRQLADGGIWTADQALKYGLIDKVGYLDDAIQEARDLAKLGDDWKAVTYERPSLLAELLTGVKVHEQTAGLDPAKLADAATPRLWYLAPQSELSGVLKAAGH
jgi:protease-4